MLAWAQGLDALKTFGLEGTSGYGAGLARHLRRQGQVVVEVIRPNRQARRRNGKSDPADAAEALATGGLANATLALEVAPAAIRSASATMMATPGLRGPRIASCAVVLLAIADSVRRWRDSERGRRAKP